MIEQTRREYLIIRVMKNSKMQPNGCREWTATRNNRGYGLIHFAINHGDGWKASIPAHRAHYMAHHNIILERNQFVLHKCDNPACVNIDHLFLGSAKDNMQDKLAKGRNAKRYKLHIRQCKFTDEQIKAISMEKGSLRAVSLRFGVSHSYVSKLRRGKAKPLLCKVDLQQEQPFVELLSLADMIRHGWQS